MSLPFGSGGAGYPGRPLQDARGMEAGGFSRAEARELLKLRYGGNLSSERISQILTNVFGPRWKQSASNANIRASAGIRLHITSAPPSPPRTSPPMTSKTQKKSYGHLAKPPNSSPQTPKEEVRREPKRSCLKGARGHALTRLRVDFTLSANSKRKTRIGCCPALKVKDKSREQVPHAAWSEVDAMEDGHTCVQPSMTSHEVPIALRSALSLLVFDH